MKPLFIALIFVMGSLTVHASTKCEGQIKQAVMKIDPRVQQGAKNCRAKVTSLRVGKTLSLVGSAEVICRLRLDNGLQVDSPEEYLVVVNSENCSTAATPKNF